jgi:hypothetical protein
MTAPSSTSVRIISCSNLRRIKAMNSSFAAFCSSVFVFSYLNRKNNFNFLVFFISACSSIITQICKQFRYISDLTL